MCGFIAYDKNKTGSRDLISEISYRGLPGFEGKAEYGSFIFEHISLPFVNLDPSVATQPVYHNGIPGVFVGEIFNYDPSFPSDTYYIHEKFHTQDEEIFHSFDGFWAYVTYFHGNLIGFTDYLSQKPLYYRTDVEAMASEIDILKQVGEVTLDKLYISDVLKWGYCPDNRTPYEEIKQVPPGCFVYKFQTYSYWNWDKVYYGESLKQDLITSVKRRMQGQREISILLSGGLDSSIIYSILKSENLPITAIHIENGESQFAKLLTDKITFLEPDLNISIEDSLNIHQVPVDLGSVIPQIAMGKKLKELGFNCVITGDGADELFGGYRRSKEYDSQYSDVFRELPYYHLPRLDRTLMKFTIEQRSPFLAPYIVKRALSLSWNQRCGNKEFLKNEFKNSLPEEILNRDKLPLKSQEIVSNPFEERKKLVNHFMENYEQQMD